jgi:nucleoside-diphosphate-sugar epimerase
MNYLLVGSKGLIGSQVAQHLESQNNQVVKIDSSFASGNGFFNYEAVETLFQQNNFDCVISTAWNTDLNTYRSSPDNFRYSEATLNLAELSKRYQVPKFLALGSAAEYGDRNFNCLAGVSELVPNNPYSLSKISTFRSIEFLLKSSNTIFVWCRIFQPYGINQDPNRFLPFLISSLTSGIRPVINHPDFIFDWIHTSDIARALVYIIENDFEGAMDIGTSVGTSNIELFHLLLKISGRDPNGTNDSSDSTAQGLVMSQEARLLTSGWRPTLELPLGLSTLIGDLK